MPTKFRCPDCGGLVSRSEMTCPRCGCRFRRGGRKGLGLWGACLAILLLGGLYGLFARFSATTKRGGGIASAPPAAAAPAATPTPVATPTPAGTAVEGQVVPPVVDAFLAGHPELGKPLFAEAASDWAQGQRI